MAQLQQAQSRGQSSATEPPRILRIGIIQSGKIVEERLVRKRENVTIGQSAKNMFVVPASNVLPRMFTLFELTPSGYALNFSEGMDGRIAFDVNVTPVTLPQLRSKATKQGDWFHVLLNEHARGKVVIGDVTVLFQFVKAPPIQARPQLPPSVRGSLMQGLDWAMIGVVALSVISHVGLVIYLQNVDWPRKPDIEEIPDRFVQMIAPPKKQEEKPKEDPNAAKLAADAAAKKAARDAARKAAAEDARKRAAEEDANPELKAQRDAARRARIAAEVGNMAVLKFITANSAEGGGGAYADLLARGDASGDSDRVFGSVGGVGVATSGDGNGLRSAKGAGGAGSARGISGLRAGSVGEVGTGERGAERTVRGHFKDVGKVEVDGTLSSDVVVNTIRQRRAAITNCYERALKVDPSLAGKVVLRFTVSGIGKVIKAEAEEDLAGNTAVSSCMIALVSTWRFPAPPQGQETTFAYPFIFQASK